MYKSNLSKGRIAVSARRGPPVQIDFESHDVREKQQQSPTNSNTSKFTEKEDADFPKAEMSTMNPRPIFNKGRQMNNKRVPQNSQDQSYNENHLEMARLLSMQWKKVEDGRNPNKDGESLYELYREKDSTSLGNFQPFDLENYWGKKLLNSLSKPDS